MRKLGVTESGNSEFLCPRFYSIAMRAKWFWCQSTRQTDFSVSDMLSWPTCIL